MKKFKTISNCVLCAFLFVFIFANISFAEEVGATMRERMNRLRANNKELIKINKQLQKEIKKLSRANEKTSISQKAQTQASTQTLPEDYLALKKELAEHKELLFRANKDIGFYNERIRALQEAFDQAKAPNTETKKAHAKEIGRMSQQKIALSKSLELANDKIRAQEDQIKTLSQSKDEIAKLKEQRDELQSQLLVAMNQVKDVEASIPSLIEALRKPLEERIAAQKSELEKVAALSREAQARVKHAERAKREMQSQLEATQKTNNKREEQMSKIADEVIKERDTIKNLTQELAQLKQMNEKSTQKIAALTAENNQAKETIALNNKSEEELAEMERKKTFLEKQLAIFNDRTKNINMITNELKQVQQPFSDEIERLEENIESLKKTVNEKDVIIKALRNQKRATLASDGGKIELDDLINIREELNKAMTVLSDNQ